MERVYLVKAPYGGGRMAFEEHGDAMAAARALVNDKHPEDAVEAVPFVRSEAREVELARIPLDGLLGRWSDGEGVPGDD